MVVLAWAGFAVSSCVRIYAVVPELSAQIRIDSWILPMLWLGGGV